MADEIFIIAEMSANHCGDIDLLTIRDMIDRFGPQGVRIGLSDHSMSIGCNEIFMQHQ